MILTTRRSRVECACHCRWSLVHLKAATGWGRRSHSRSSKIPSRRARLDSSAESRIRTNWGIFDLVCRAQSGTGTPLRIRTGSSNLGRYRGCRFARSPPLGLPLWIATDPEASTREHGSTDCGVDGSCSSVKVLPQSRDKEKRRSFLGAYLAFRPANASADPRTHGPAGACRLHPTRGRPAQVLQVTKLVYGFMLTICRVQRVSGK